jgi:muramoyltetrapeptide carboxypeptidase
VAVSAPVRTSAGLLKFRPVRPGSRVALVAPASAFDRSEFDAGVAELRRLGLEPVWHDSVFDRSALTAGTPQRRAEALLRAIDGMDADAVVAVRGGYGSVEVLPLLDLNRLRRARTAVVGYSDLTSLHAYLTFNVGLASVHGAMVDGRLAKGASAYDSASFLRSLSDEPLGEVTPEGLEVIRPGEAGGPLFGGTLSPLLASFGTPYEFRPPPGQVLFIDEVNERPYRLHRMLTQLKLSGRLAGATAVVFGQMPGCDEPGGRVSARDVIVELVDGFPGPVLLGFPSGHTTSPLVSVPFGVTVRVVAPAGGGRARVAFDEAAACP